MAGVTTAPPPAPEGRLRRLPATLCIRNHTAATGCSKAPQGLLSPTEVCGLFVHIMWLHRAAGGDRGALVVFSGYRLKKETISLSSLSFLILSSFLLPWFTTTFPALKNLRSSSSTDRSRSC